MNVDTVVQKDVQEAIKWEPLLYAAKIGVLVTNGVVTLTGTVDNYTKKTQADDIAKNVSGVKEVIDNINVRLMNLLKESDSEIAVAVDAALNSNWAIPNDTVDTSVNDGWVTLTGKLDREYKRVAVKEAVARLSGVAGVSNNTTLEPERTNGIEELDIRNALARHWALSKCSIHVTISGIKVTLTGSVNSWYQKDEAGKIVWKAPGVGVVDNKLIIESDYSLVSPSLRRRNTLLNRI